MKKSFFKKLSFVLALAMILSIITPAAGVFAASKAKLNATSKCLYLDVDSKNVYDFNILNKVSGWKYAWKSSDENVAKVDKYGYTTATGIGSAKITVSITDKNGKKVATLTADILVRDNIDELSIYYQGTDTVDLAKLAVGKEYDFGRKIVKTVAGLTKSSGIVRWTVDKADATISDAGVFVASKAGEYTITANAFQSKTKYAEWLKDTTKTGLITATATQKVTVIAGIVKTQQVNTTKFNVTFDSDMSKTDLSKDTAKVYQVINGKLVATGTEKIKAVTLDTTGKVATVEMYSAFNTGVKYNFVYAGLTGEFTSATTNLSDVAGIVFNDFNATVSTPKSMLANVYAVNKDGVVILTGDTSTEFANALSFTYDDDYTKGCIDTAKNVYIYANGYAAKVTAKFNYYSYNTTTKVYDNITFSDGAVITGVVTDTSLNSATMQYAVTDSTTAPASDSTAWTTPITLAAKDSPRYIATRYKNNDAVSTDPYTYEDGNDSKFSYTSSDTDKLMINGDYIYPVAAGVVTVIVKDTANDNKVVGTFDVTIQPTRAFASATIDNLSVNVGNNTNPELGFNGKAATITVKDTMGAAAAATATPAIVNAPSGVTGTNPLDVGFTYHNTASDTDYGKIEVNLNACSKTAGAYYYKITVTSLGTTKDVYLSVYVVEGNSGDDLKATTWRLELDATSVDLKNVAEAKDIAINVYGYNAKGVKVAKLVAGSQYTVAITKGGTDLKNLETPWSYTDTSCPVIKGVSPAALSMLAADTYLVTATAKGASNPSGRVDGTPIGTMAFTVTDTTTKSFTIDNPVVTATGTVTGAALSIVKTAFSFVLNGTKLTDDQELNLSNVSYVYNNDVNASISGGTILIKSVDYTVTNTNGTTRVYTFTLNVPITLK